VPIYVIDRIQQKNDAVFPLIGDEDLLGGFRVALDDAERDAIPAAFRKTGMFVWTCGTNKLWRLESAPSELPGTWAEFSGGGTGTSLVDTSLLAGEALTAGWVVAIDGSSQVVKANASGVGAALEPYGIVTADIAPGSPAPVVTGGIAAYAPGGLMPGQILYLAQGGGMPANAPGTVDGTYPDGSISGRRIARIGQARTANTIQVRVQFIAQT